MTGMYYDDDEGGNWALRAAFIALILLTLLVGLWVGLRAFGGDSSTLPVPSSGSQLATEPEAPTTLSEGAEDAPEEPVALDDADDELVSDDTDDIDDTAAAAVTALADDPTSAEPSEIESAGAATEPVVAPTEVSYDTLPDGRPVPVLVIFDGELITLSGAVPSSEASTRLSVLALANSTVPDAEVASFLTVEPTVPVGVGVRVIEMNSVRFAEGSPTVTLEHAEQLNRVAAVMAAFPDVTVEVIGHADQRGDETSNFQLSTARARAAADFLAAQGVDPSRLSSRGAGESDLLTLNNDETALALNRRTEFVFFGLLLEPEETT